MKDEPLQRTKCGCAYRGERWVKLCDAHEAEQVAHSARVAEDRKTQHDIEDLLS